MSEIALVTVNLDTIKIDHTSSSYTLGGGEEVTLVNVDGKGHVNMLVMGDGDGKFNLRVYVDGAVEDEFPTNEKRVCFLSFQTNFKVSLFNPSSPGTGTSVSFNIRGVKLITT